MTNTSKLGGTPIRTLRVPIDAPYIDRLIAILTSHGATCVETRDCTWPGFLGEREGHKEFTLTFPDGTTRVEDLTLYHTTPFSLEFPDGYQLLGADVSGVPVLWLPRQEGE